MLNTQYIKLGYNDVALVQATISLDSRSIPNPLTEQNHYPVFIAPMSQLIDGDNVCQFNDAKLIPIVSRSKEIHIKLRMKLSQMYWCAYGIRELKRIFIHEKFSFDVPPRYICIDVANGTMPQVYKMADYIKDKYPNCLIMAGSVANPYAVREYIKHRIDFIRTGIGGGSQCTTSIITGVHYPPISLINEMRQIRDSYLAELHLNNPGKEFTKPLIVADGGISDFGRIMKALVAGADYVMVGKMAGEIEECCHGYHIDNDGRKVRHFYGMSTKTAQDDYGNETRVHSEGIHSNVLVRYDLAEFVSRLDQAMRSSMSYLGCTELSQLTKVEMIRISPSAYYDFASNKL